MLLAASYCYSGSRWQGSDLNRSAPLTLTRAIARYQGALRSLMCVDATMPLPKRETHGQGHCGQHIAGANR